MSDLLSNFGKATLAPQGKSEPMAVENMPMSQMAQYYQGAPMPQYRPAQGAADWLYHAGQMAQYALPSSFPIGEATPKVLSAPQDPALRRLLEGAAPQQLIEGPAETSTVSTEQAVGSAKTAAENYSTWFDNLLQKKQQEGYGQYVLEGASEKGRTVGQIVEDFWRNTYEKLPEKGKTLFHRYIERETGLKPGGYVGGPGDGIAKNWEEVFPAHWYGNSPTEHLEGTERGLIAFMEMANQQAGGLGQASLQLGGPK